MTLPPGRRVLRVEVPPADQRRRILLRMLRRARGPLRCCRKDIMRVVREVGEEMAAEAMRALLGNRRDNYARNYAKEVKHP